MDFASRLKAAIEENQRNQETKEQEQKRWAEEHQREANKALLAAQQQVTDKLRLDDFTVKGNFYCVLAMHEACRYDLIHRCYVTPFMNGVEAWFNAEGLKTERYYGGNERYTGCDLMLLVPRK